MKLSFSTRGWSSLSWEECIELAVSMDFGGIAAKETGDGALDDTANPYEHKKLGEVTDQFMVGDFLMVAPLLPGNEARDVVLPADCKWYDFFTGEYVGRGEIKRFERRLDQMLVLVREGGMIPMLAREELDKPTPAKVTVKCFGALGEHFLYDDDGVSFDFENGAYRMTKLAFCKEGDRVCGRAEVLHDGYPSPYELEFC